MQTGLISFEVVSRVNGIDVDLRSVAREYAIDENEISLEELLRIIKSFEFLFQDDIVEYTAKCTYLFSEGIPKEKILR